jgi:endogenous inhibitor of DNA gyrase (YacG/DUF329 family)
MWWSGNPTRPFCSPACKVPPLGGWLDETCGAAEAPLPLEREPALVPDAARAGG